jgi:hypothetical protein
VKASDITEEMRDLRIHLDNDEKLRQRLQELLAKAEKVEDTLKIEAELTRVTEALDKTKGRIRFLESQIAMSSIRVELYAPTAMNARGSAPKLPFDWIEELGSGLVEGQVQQNVRQAGMFGKGPRFKPPTGFVRYFENDSEVEAMSADGIRIHVVRRDNVDKAPLSFWSALAQKTLVKDRSLGGGGEETGKDFYTFRGFREVGGKPMGYVLVLKRNSGHVVAFEAWGERTLIEQNADALRTSGLSADPG